MDQELKQRLIGAAVITALAAIFVPMLFDDPIDQSGKSINELSIPELPNKAQDVEIMPLPEKAEDVATVTPMAKPEPPVAAPEFQGEEEAETGHGVYPSAVLMEPRSSAPVSRDSEVAEEDDFAPAPSEAKRPAAHVDLPPEIPVKPAPAAEPVQKPSPAALENATVRWYLNAGSFSRKSNAVNLLDSLKKQGFSVSIKETAGDKGTIYKVRVGPMLDRAKAQEVKDKLSKLNVNSFVASED